jgi:hypothetical protein
MIAAGFVIDLPRFAMVFFAFVARSYRETILSMALSNFFASTGLDM